MPIALLPWSSASERKNVSMGSRKPRGSVGSVITSVPCFMAIFLFGGMIWIVLASTFAPSSACRIGIWVNFLNSSGSMLTWVGSR